VVETVKAICSTPGEAAKICSVCLYKDATPIAVLGHAWGEFKEVKAATCLEAGSQERVCANDKTHVDTKTIAKLSTTGHVWWEFRTVTQTCKTQGHAVFKCEKCGAIEDRDFTPSYHEAALLSASELAKLSKHYQDFANQECGQTRRLYEI
jgi:hypothetical protein